MQSRVSRRRSIVVLDDTMSLFQALAISCLKRVVELLIFSDEPKNRP